MPKTCQTQKEFTLAAIVKRAREASGFTVEQLASRIGYRVDTLRAVELRHYRAGKGLLQRLLKALPLKKAERVFLERLLANTKVSRTPPVKATPRPDLYRLAEVRGRLQIAEQKLNALIAAGEFGVLVDIRNPGGKRPQWRITRIAYEAFLARRIGQAKGATVAWN